MTSYFPLCVSTILPGSFPTEVNMMMPFLSLTDHFQEVIKASMLNFTFGRTVSGAQPLSGRLALNMTGGCIEMRLFLTMFTAHPLSVMAVSTTLKTPALVYKCFTVSANGGCSVKVAPSPKFHTSLAVFPEDFSYINFAP